MKPNTAVERLKLASKATPITDVNPAIKIAHVLLIRPVAIGRFSVLFINLSKSFSYN
jgi:hypothetical protein